MGLLNKLWESGVKWIEYVPDEDWRIWEAEGK